MGTTSGHESRAVGEVLPEDNLRVDTVSEAEEQRLLLAFPPYLRDMIRFAINTGLRTSDIFNLEWTEVDIEQERLKKIAKKNRWPLSLPLNDTAFEIVEARWGIHHGPYVFYNPMTGDKFCFAADSRVSGHRDSQGATRAFQRQHHDAVRSIQR
jgi:integrase